MKLYRISYSDGQFQTGDLQFEFIAAENGEEARAIADLRTSDMNRNRTFKTYHFSIQEIILDGYEIIIKKKK